MVARESRYCIIGGLEGIYRVVAKVSWVIAKALLGGCYDVIDGC